MGANASYLNRSARIANDGRSVEAVRCHTVQPVASSGLLMFNVSRAHDHEMGRILPRDELEGHVQGDLLAAYELKPTRAEPLDEL